MINKEFHNHIDSKQFFQKLSIGLTQIHKKNHYRRNSKVDKQTILPDKFIWYSWFFFYITEDCLNI